MAVKTISRQDAEAVISEYLSAQILQDTPTSSTFMSMARRLPNMAKGVERMRVLDVLPMAYFVEGDTGWKQTTNQAWDNVYMTAAELAVIVPIADNILEDSDIDIIGEVVPRCIEAAAARIDEATIFGVGRPSVWQNDIITAARQAGNNVSWSAGDNLYDKLLGENGVWSKVEEAGFDVNGAIANFTMKAKLRGLKDSGGMPIYNTNMQGRTPYAVEGVPLYFPRNGAFDKNIAQLVVGDFSQAVYAIRKDFKVDIFTEGVIQDPVNEKIVYNLMQNDMTAIRIVMRLGWALPNYATRLDPDRVSCPFAYLEPATAVKDYEVKFTVEDNLSSPIVGAKVNVNGSNKVTDSSGEVTFNLRPGSYPCKIKAAGYTTVNENVVISDTTVDKDITMNKIQ